MGSSIRPRVPDPLAQLERRAGLATPEAPDNDTDPLAALERRHGLTGSPAQRSDPRTAERAMRALGQRPRLDVRPDQTRVTPGPDGDALISRVVHGVSQAGKQIVTDPIGTLKEELSEPLVSALRAMNQPVEGDVVSPAILRHGDPTGEKRRRVGTRITKENTPGALTREEARQAQKENFANLIAAPVGLTVAKVAKRAGVKGAAKRAVIGVSAGAAPVGAAYSPDDPAAGALVASTIGGLFGAAGPHVGRGFEATARGGAKIIGEGVHAAQRGAARVAENVRGVRRSLSDLLEADGVGVRPESPRVFDENRAIETLIGALPDERGLKSRPESERTVSAPAPGTVGGIRPMRVADIGVDPARFQFKGNVDPESGAGAELRAVQKFNPTLAGVISVWRDPSTGKHWVVNGHHRLDLAKRTGQGSVNVQVLDAKTAGEARAIGAMVNIAEGRGSALDAAKFFRDSGLGPEGLAQQGVSLTGHIARGGLALSRLTPDVFDKVAVGKIPEAHGVLIGRALDTPAGQRAAATLVERSPRSLSAAQVEELVAQVRQAGEATFTQESLFGQEQLTQSLIYERAEVSAELRNRLEADRKLFGYVTRGERATELQKAGNVINVDESARLAQTSAIFAEAFTREAHAAGPVGSAITQAARRVASGEKTKAVVDDIFEPVRQALQEALEGRAATRGSALEARNTDGQPAIGRDADRGQETVGAEAEEEGRVRDSDDPNQAGFFAPDELRPEDFNDGELSMLDDNAPLLSPDMKGAPRGERIRSVALRIFDQVYEGPNELDAAEIAYRNGIDFNTIAEVSRTRGYGYITTAGRFVTPQQALRIAAKAGQLRRNSRVARLLAKGVVPLRGLDQNDVRNLATPDVPAVANIGRKLPEEEGTPPSLRPAIRHPNGAVQPVERFAERGEYYSPRTDEDVQGVVEGYADREGRFYTRKEAEERFGQDADIGPLGRSPEGQPLFDPAGPDLFGREEPSPDDQGEMFSGREGTEASRSLQQQEASARAELDRLRAHLSLDTDPKRRQATAQRMVELFKLLNRGRSLTLEELEARAIAEQEAAGEITSGPDQMTLLHPASQPTTTALGIAQKAGIKPPREDILALVKISRGLAEAVGVPLRQGRFRAKAMQALGVFIPKPEVIRVRRFRKLDTVTHEIGHYVSKKYLRNPTMQGAKTRGAAKLTTQVRQELVKLGKDLYGSRRPNAGYGEEGIAQVARFYVTQPAKLLSDAPNAAAWWDSVLAQEPALRAALDQARSDFERYMAAPANARIASLISVGEHTRLQLHPKDFIRHVVDDLVEFREATEALGKPDNAVNHAYVLARLSKGDPGRALDMVEKGVRDFFSRKRTTRGLAEILDDVGREHLQAFREYLIARQVITKTGQGIDTGFDVQAAKEVVKSADPRFAKLAQDVWDFRTGLLTYLRDAGLLTQTEFDGIRQKNPTPTPFYRVFDPNETGSREGGGKTLARNFSTIKRMTGSDRPVIDPLESLVKDAFSIVSIAEKHNAAAVLIKQAMRTEGGGRWVEELIETPQEKRTVHVQKVMDQLVEMGFELSDTLTPQQELLLEGGKLTAFYDRVTPSGREIKDLVLPVLIHGRRRWFAIKDRDLWNAIQRLDEQELQVWEKLMSVPAQALRTGATLSPDFIGVNPIRDAFSTAIYSRGGMRPPGWHLARGMFELVKKGDLYDQWVAEGGLSSGMIGADRVTMQRTVSEIMHGKRSKLYRVVTWPKTILGAGKEVGGWLHHPFDALARTLGKAVDPLRMAAEFAENANRLGEFAEVTERATKQGKTQRAAATEGAIASRDLIDFRRAGIQGRVLNRLIAFFNAAVQDIAKFTTEHDPRQLASPEGRARMLSVMARAAAWITVPSVALYLSQKDDPLYQEIPEYVKSTGWVFITRDENGEPSIWWIPRAHLLGIVYGYLPEKIMGYVEGIDPDALDNLADALYDYGTPPLMPTAVRPIYENVRNRSLLTDRPIVPARVQGLEPSQQSTPYTGETARTLGELTNTSPAKIENLVSGYAGGLGRLATKNVSDPVIRVLREAKGQPPMRPLVPEAEGIEAIPLARRFHIPVPGAGAESVGRIFEEFQHAEQKRRTWKRLLEEGRREDASRYLAKHQDEILSVATEEDAGVRGPLREVEAELSKLFSERRTILTAPMKDEARRRAIDELDKLIVRVAKSYQPMTAGAP